MQRPTQRGRPRKYATAKDKAAADYECQRNKRQKAAAGDRGLPYSNFHNLHYPVQQLDNSQSSAFAQLQEQDISNFLPPPSPPLVPTTEGSFPDHDESLRPASIVPSPSLGTIKTRFGSKRSPKWGCGVLKFGPYRLGRSRVADWPKIIPTPHLGLASVSLGLDCRSFQGLHPLLLSRTRVPLCPPGLGTQ
jgi:hypothetical protein